MHCWKRYQLSAASSEVNLLFHARSNKTEVFFDLSSGRIRKRVCEGKSQIKTKILSGLFCVMLNKRHRISCQFFPASCSNIRNFTKQNYLVSGREEEGSRLWLFKRNKDSSFFCMLCVAHKLALFHSSNTIISREGEWWILETRSHDVKAVFL